MDVYCDMANGGWTLCYLQMVIHLLGQQQSKLVSIWCRFCTSSLGNSDYHGPTYNRLHTDEIRLCLENVSQCHVFNHQYDIPLKTFFTNNITYTEFSYRSVGHSDVGSSNVITQFENELNRTVDRYECQWLGINDQVSISSIGFLADGNAGCVHMGGTYTHHDDTALGVGLQSCMDTNGCSTGGTGHKAGRGRAVDGQQDIILGPWFVFGR